MEHNMFKFDSNISISSSESKQDQSFNITGLMGGRYAVSAKYIFSYSHTC